MPSFELLLSSCEQRWADGRRGWGQRAKASTHPELLRTSSHPLGLTPPTTPILSENTQPSKSGKPEWTPGADRSRGHRRGRALSWVRTLVPQAADQGPSWQWGPEMYFPPRGATGGQVLGPAG